MKKILRVGGRVVLILAITLALDYVLTATVFSGLKRTWIAADAANLDTYIWAPWHHDLMPNRKSMRTWGRIRFPWRTDKYGFRTGRCAAGEAEKDHPAIFVIGDSFVEALGVSYEESFTGLMACDAASQGKAVWNLGVASYSPIIYYRKVRGAAKKLGLRPQEVFVFLDLSDIDDEANVYREWPDGTVHFASEPLPAHVEAARDGADGGGGNGPVYTGPPFNFTRFVLDNFASIRFVYDLFLVSSFGEKMSYGRERARWSLDPDLMKAWGERGLASAARNLDKLVQTCRDWHCRVTLVVYPWPDSIVARDRDGIQVTYWRDWAAREGVRFVDGFAPFFDLPATETMQKYFIRGDVHFTAAGNRLLYEAVKQAVDGQW
ncbi:MAG: SGNH/GDSL hydrolase family protein [Proteobacteria bacterium]|nr:SGNH/GDSL hydrolase family protein [Pseudomonadota bacterium]